MSGSNTVDLLMITYNRPEYTRLALKRLLATCTDNVRVWLWHNGDDGETLAVVRDASSHTRVHRFHHSHENKMLREPTNWFWTEAEGDLLGKVDDDCLVSHGWIETLCSAHADVPEFGIISCWPFLQEDYIPELSQRKIQDFGRHQLLQNFWVGGSGYLMKRCVLTNLGLLGLKEGFSGYCKRAAWDGWVNGWYFPFLYMDHMEDPRSPYTTLRTEEDFQQRPTLSSRVYGTPSLDAMHQRARRAAIEVQEASIDLQDYFGWRARVRRIGTRLLGRGRVQKFRP